jgi:hypothetical protein
MESCNYPHGFQQGVQNMRISVGVGVVEHDRTLKNNLLDLRHVGALPLKLISNCKDWRIASSDEVSLS